MVLPKFRVIPHAFFPKRKGLPPQIEQIHGMTLALKFGLHPTGYFAALGLGTMAATHHEN
jgi:hypothetical protein